MIFKEQRHARSTRINEEILRVKRLFAEVGRLNLNVKKVFLFGSAATGKIRGSSDIDLIIVQETNKRFLDRLEVFFKLIQPVIATDVLVYTPEEFDNMMKEKNRFLLHAVRQAQIIYEQET
ncbi:MAG: nucleotidyltransferase domain-containing protein [Deltaproteobacteria bacterium]|nr:nucleotidyltransferase domain-containing protein [Deltaproteobacteria bacterium]